MDGQVTTDRPERSVTQPIGQCRGSCHWSMDADGMWSSECGVDWTFGDGGPVDNSMRYCHGCGKPLHEEPARFDEWGDPILDDDEEGQ